MQSFIPRTICIILYIKILFGFKPIRVVHAKKDCYDFYANLAQNTKPLELSNITIFRIIIIIFS